MSVKKGSILIVDDENANLKILTHILGPEYTIYTTTNGTDALKIAADRMPDIILLDILMPGKDGYQTLSEIKKNDKIKKIPVIFISGLDSDEDEEKGLSLDAADYIMKPFSPVVVRLRVRNQIQIITQMRTIEQLSLIDPLTKIPNRRSFDERLLMEWKQAIREQTQISVLMMDLDKFKSINDVYGHQQGDVVLQTIANIFAAVLKRPCDFAARWGGEEFVVLLPNTTMEGAVDVAESIRQKVEYTEIQRDDGSNIKMTISIGVNSFTPGLENKADDFMDLADKRLFAAKEAGRNRVISS